MKAKEWFAKLDDELKEEFNQSVEEYVDENPPVGGVRKKQKIKELTEEFNDFLSLKNKEEGIKEAMQLIINEMSEKISEEAANQVFKELGNADNIFNAYVEQEINSSSPFENLASIQNMYGLSDETILNFYNLGNIFFEEGAYEKAKPIFDLLLVFNNTIPAFWVASANSSLAFGDFHTAINLYTQGKEYFPEDIGLILNSAIAYCENKDFSLAKEELIKGIKLLEKYPEEKAEWQETIHQIENLIQ